MRRLIEQIWFRWFAPTAPASCISPLLCSKRRVTWTAQNQLPLLSDKVTPCMPAATQANRRTLGSPSLSSPPPRSRGQIRTCWNRRTNPPVIHSLHACHDIYSLYDDDAEQAARM